jgi:C-terminal processing protease CtpA/Prc
LSDSYEGKGIEPDVPVEIAEELAETNLYLISDEEDNQLAAAIAELEKRAK